MKMLKTTKKTCFHYIKIITYESSSVHPSFFMKDAWYLQDITFGLSNHVSFPYELYVYRCPKSKEKCKRQQREMDQQNLTKVRHIKHSSKNMKANLVYKIYAFSLQTLINKSSFRVEMCPLNPVALSWNEALAMDAFCINCIMFFTLLSENFSTANLCKWIMTSTMKVFFNHADEKNLFEVNLWRQWFTFHQQWFISAMQFSRWQPCAFLMIHWRFRLKRMIMNKSTYRNEKGDHTEKTGWLEDLAISKDEQRL